MFATLGERKRRNFFQPNVSKGSLNQEEKCWQRIGSKAGFKLTHPHSGLGPRTANSTGNQSS